MLAAFLVVGGFSATVGAVSGRWAGEFIGLPLVATGLVSLGIISWSSSRTEAPWLAAGNLCLLTGFAVLLLGRWRAVLAVYYLVRWVGRRSA